MKVTIEVTSDGSEDEVVIKCSEINAQIKKIYQAAKELSEPIKFTFYKHNQTFFFPIGDVLFFETEKNTVYAHTADDVFRTKYRLYELENLLPSNFLRISKSAIANTKHILSIDKNIASSSLVQFRNSYKKVYVSRLYYKILKIKLSERSHLL